MPKTKVKTESGGYVEPERAREKELLDEIRSIGEQRDALLVRQRELTTELDRRARDRAAERIERAAEQVDYPPDVEPGPTSNPKKTKVGVAAIPDASVVSAPATGKGR